MNCIHNVWLKLALLVSLLGMGGLMSCSDDEEETKPIEKLNNQVSLNAQVADIRSAVWTQNEAGVYTLYLSPREGLKTSKEMKEKNDYLMLVSPNVKGALTDDYQISYQQLQLTAATECTVRDFQVMLDDEHLTLNLYAMTASRDELNAGYEGKIYFDEEKKPIEKLNKQISLNGQVVDVRSVVWTKNDTGVYTLYLSPREGLKTYESMMEVEDYLMLTTPNVAGELVADYTVSYQKLQLTPATECKERKMSVTLDNGSLALNLYAMTAAGDELNAGYEGEAVEMQPLQLVNQWQLNHDEPNAIESVLEWRNQKTTEFYLSKKGGLKSPAEIGDAEYVKIVVPAGVQQSVDLATAEGVQIVAGNLDSKEAKVLGGTLNFSKNEIHKSMVITLDANLDGNRLRANWEGAAVVGYNSTNQFALTAADGQKAEVALSKVFIHHSAATYTVAFGLKENPESAEELKDRYAVQFNVPTLNQNIDLSNPQSYNLKVFDYANYQTFDSAKEGMKGSLKVWSDDNKKVYFYLDGTLANGMHIAAEWFGTFTESEAFDLTPVKPFRSNFKITQKNGEVTKDMDVIELQVRENPNFQSNVSGATYSAYEFYFVNKYTKGSGVDDASATPVLVVNKDFIGKKDIDLTQAQTIFDFSYLPFNSSGIASPTEYSGTTDKGTLSISKDGDNWKISFSVLDFGNWWGWGAPSGTKATFSAEWEGPASPYTGKK